jgi:hypothetical protein
MVQWGTGKIAGLAIAVALVSLAIGGLAAWAMRGNEVARLQRDVNALQQRVATLETSLSAALEAAKQAEEALARSQAATTTAESASAGASASSTGTASEGGAGGTGIVSSTLNLSRQFAFIVGVQKFGTRYYVVADFAQFLTGDAAARAAAEAGEESPPPNDYFIKNENPLLRVIPVQGPTVRVKMYSEHEGVDTDGYYLSFDRWYRIYSGDRTVGPITRDDMSTNGYWLTIRSGKITAMEEQWVP